MTKVILKGSVLVKDAPTNIIERLERELTFDNPKYKQAVKNGYYIDPAKTPMYLEYYKRRGSSIIVPRALCGMICKFLRMDQKEVNDFTVAPAIDLTFTGALRPYQEAAQTDVLARRYGILEAGTGAGKTVMGISIAAERGVRTLVIVHNKELLNQWKDRFAEFTNVAKKDIGIIGDGKFKIGDVTVGIINSVQKKADAIKNEFGLVLYDECHRTLGDMWVKTINTLRPKFHVGLSATPYRSDGLTKALFRMVGPKLHVVDRKYLEATGAILIPDIIKIQTTFSYNFNNDYSTMLSRLAQNDARNIMVANAIIDEFRKTKEPLMIVSDRVSHCEILTELIQGEAGIRAVVLSGKVSKTIRKQAVADVKSGKFNVLVSTIPLLGEGFDAPTLNGMFLTTPIKFGGRLLQTVGRVLRPSASGRMPRVFDFRDTLVPVLRYSGFARDRIYKKYGWRDV